MKKSPLALVAIAMTATAMTATACSGSADTGASGTGDGDVVIDGTLNFAINEDPGNLFRHVNTSATLSYVYPWAYESLVYYDESGEAKSWLAESWEETPTSLTFTIREGVTCEDGTDLTAETVANNFRWIVDPANSSSMAGLVVPSDTSVEHDNEAHTLTLTTESPNSFLLASLGVHPIYCQAALDDPDSVAGATNGTGLFQLTEAVPNDHYTFTRNEEYDWAPEGGNDAQTPGVPNEVVISVVENPTTRANLLLSGELQMADVQGPDEERVASQADALITAQLNTGGFAYSQAEGKPTTDEAVRVALTKALDLDTLMRVQTADQGSRATALAVYPPVICQYDAATTNLPTTDVAGAEQMLDDAGWTVGSDGVRTKDGERLSLKLTYQTRWPETASTTELIKEQWEAVGAEVELEGSEYNAFSEKVFAEGASSNFDAVWLAANYNVPNVLSAFVAGPTPPDGSNMAALSNPDYDALVEEASNFTGQEACDVWEQAEAEMYSSADYVPFATRPSVTYSRGVQATIPENLIAPAFLLVQP